MSIELIVTVEPKKNYLNNKDLLKEVLQSKQDGQMTDKLARMLYMLCLKYSKKSNFVNYSFIEDMRAYALLMLVKTWNSFNEQKSSNPFAFFTQCVHNSFVQFLNQEKKQRNVKNAALVDCGLSPSFSYIAEYEEEYHERKERMLNGDFESVIVPPVSPDVEHV